MNGRHTIILETVLPLPPEAAFPILTRAEHLTRWFSDIAESDPRMGGRLVLRWTGPNATPQPFSAGWVTFEPPARCAFEGGHAGYPDGHAGRVSFELEPEGPGSRLKVCHTMPDDPRYESWTAAFQDAWPRTLLRLTAYAATQTAAGPAAGEKR